MSKYQRFGSRAIPYEKGEGETPILLHVALNAPTYSSAALTQAFKDAGYYVHVIDWQSVKLNLCLDGLEFSIKEMADTTMPDVIFLHIQNSEVLSLDFVKQLAEKSFVVNYTFDIRDDERMLWMDEMAPHIGLTLFASQEDVERCYEKGIKNTAVMQASCDMEMYRPYPTIKSGPEIIFIGGRYTSTNLNFPLAQERQDMIDFLKKEYGERFVSMGMGQEIGHYIHPHEEINAYNRAKVVISQNNYNRTLYTSDRLYRIMASGAFCLTKYFNGIDLLFGGYANHYLDTWKDFNELKDKIDYYLDKHATRESIANAGCEYVRTHHTWRMRVEEMKALIQKHSNKNA